MSTHTGQFQELHQRLQGQNSLLLEVYGVKPSQGNCPNLYDILNSPKVDKYLRLKQQQCPQLKPGQVDVAILEQRCTEALRIVQGARWQKESPEFCKSVQAVLEDGKSLLLDEQKEAAYRQWLGLKEETPETQLLPTIRRTKPDRRSGTTGNSQEERSYSGKVANGQTSTEETTKQTSGNTRKQPKQYIDMDAWKKRIFQQELIDISLQTYGEVFVVVTTTLVLLVCFLFGVLKPYDVDIGQILVSSLIVSLIVSISYGRALARNRASNRVEHSLWCKVAYGVSKSYRRSIRFALAKEHPSQVASEIEATIEELEQYGLNVPFQLRSQYGYTSGGQSEGKSWSQSYSQNYGSPNVTLLREIVNLSKDVSEKWNMMDSKQRALEMGFIRTRLSQEDIDLHKWITDNSLNIKNCSIQPRYYDYRNPSKWDFR
jgi:hypothetical protein